MFMASLLMYRACKPLQVGVVIARKTEARKGPLSIYTRLQCSRTRGDGISINP